MCWGNCPRYAGQYWVTGPIILDVAIFWLSIFIYFVNPHRHFFPPQLYCLTLGRLLLGFLNFMAMKMIKNIISEHDNKMCQIKKIKRKTKKTKTNLTLQIFSNIVPFYLGKHLRGWMYSFLDMWKITFEGWYWIMFWQLNSNLTVSALVVWSPLKPELRGILSGPSLSSLGRSQQSSRIPAAQEFCYFLTLWLSTGRESREDQPGGFKCKSPGTGSYFIVTVCSSFLFNWTWDGQPAVLI